MVAKRVSERELATSLAKVLERARNDEHFQVERNGQVIANVVPPTPSNQVTLRELALELAQLPPLDDVFAADTASAREMDRHGEPWQGLTDSLHIHHGEQAWPLPKD